MTKIEDNPLVCPTGFFPIDGKCEEIPYASKVRFYADHADKTIIHTHTEYVGKGWRDVRVGNHHEKTRRGEGSIKYNLMDKYYPKHDDELSLFSETSYHSSLNQGTAGKIDTYGTHEYNKDFSVYKDAGEYELLQPVKTESPKEFAKVINKVNLQKWRYVVLNWKPDGNDVLLFVKDTIHDPIRDTEKVLFKSKEFPLADKNKAIDIFNKRVKDAKEW